MMTPCPQPRAHNLSAHQLNRGSDVALGGAALEMRASLLGGERRDGFEWAQTEHGVCEEVLGSGVAHLGGGGVVSKGAVDVADDPVAALEHLAEVQVRQSVLMS